MNQRQNLSMHRPVRIQRLVLPLPPSGHGSSSQLGPLKVSLPRRDTLAQAPYLACRPRNRHPAILGPTSRRSTPHRPLA